MTTNSLTAGVVAATDATTVPSTVSGGADASASAAGSTTGSTAKSAAADTVTLQGKVQNAVKVSPKSGNVTAGGRIGSVLFVYNNKGQLRVRFMDSKNSLVYQTPPVLLARTADLMMRPSSSVSATV
jgi:hypothetical protein